MFIYDLEIKHAIPPTSAAERKPGIHYCGGWEDYLGMGLACLVCYDYTSDKYHVFGEHELKDFTQFLQLHDVAVGFNNLRFDNNLLRAHGIVINQNRCYDILAEIYSALGRRQKGYKLDDCIRANFPNAAKSGDGANAPIDWQSGFYTKVINYCLNDVRITKMLLDKIIRFGYINDPARLGHVLYLKRP